jgi:hypothetical protein
MAEVTKRRRLQHIAQVRTPLHATPRAPRENMTTFAVNSFERDVVERLSG